jgi:glycerophosphoryl diester phosphodiesterase
MVGGPHPDSVIRTESGLEVQLKVHQCVWSGEFPGNSLPAIRECYRARVARAEIDIAMLADRDFLVVHDVDLTRATDGAGLVGDTPLRAAERLRLRHAGRETDERVVLLSQVVEAIATEPYATLLELDLKDWRPWPWPRVEELAGLLAPVKDRITFGGGADWNLRRLHQVDSSLAMGFTITDYLDWLPPESSTGARNAYGYLDAHPLGWQRLSPTRDYLRDRLGAIVSLVPAARDIHVRLCAALQMVGDGLTDLADLLHARGMLLDVWTLNAGSPGWRDRLFAAVAMGADVITTETARELSRAAAETRRMA